MATTEDILNKIRGIEEPPKIEISKKTRPTTKSILESIREVADRPLIEPELEKPTEVKPSISEYEPFKSELAETMAQFFGIGERPSALIETIKKPFKIAKEQEIVGGLKTFAKGLKYLPKQIASKLIMSLKGVKGADVVNRDWGEKYIDLAQEDIEKFTAETQKEYGEKTFLPGIPIEEVARLPQNLAYSFISMGAGLGTGIPVAAAPLPGARAAAWTLGGATSAKVAYEMTSYEIMQEFLEAKNEEMMEKEGRGITAEEQKELKDEFGALAMEHGLWEALPEAISQVAFLSILTAPLTKMLGSKLARRILKALSIYTEELATETVTQMGQMKVRGEMGLPGGQKINWTDPKDWLQALGAVAPQTFLLTTTMIGAGQIVISTKQATDSLKKELGKEHPLYNKFKEKITGLGKEVEPTKAPVKSTEEILTAIRREKKPPTEPVDFEKHLEKLYEESRIEKEKEPQVEVPGREGFSILKPYIKTALRSSADIGRQSLTNLSQKKPVASSDVASILMIAPSSDLKNVSSIQSYSTKLLKISQGEKSSFDKLINKTIKDIKDVKFVSRIKKAKSLEKKVKRYVDKNFDPISIFDIVAGRLIVSDLKKVNEIFSALSNLNIVEVKDYFTKPSDFGYRGLNVKIKIPNSIVVEIQIHTPESLKIIEAIHDPYYKKEVDKEIVEMSEIKKAKEISEKIWEKKGPKLELRGLPDKEQAIQNIAKLEEDLTKEYKDFGIEEVNEKLSELWVEMEISEAGDRIPVRDEEGEIRHWLGKKSTFPKWVPEDLRRKPLFNKVMEGLKDTRKPTYPDDSRWGPQRELYNAILEELDSRLGIDTSGIRTQILENYEAIKEEKVTEPISKGIEEQKREPKEEEIKVEDIFPEEKPKVEAEKEIETLEVSETKLDTAKGKKALIDFIEKSLGFIRESDIPNLIKKFGNFALVVKDVNGQRAKMNVGDFVKLSKNKLFTDRIRSVFVNKQALPIDRIDAHEDFMEALKIDKLLKESSKEKVIDVGELVDVKGIELTTQSTMTAKGFEKFTKALTDNKLRQALKDNNIKKVIIDKPRNFSLSEQANISVSKRLIRISADATDPTDTLYHELGHQAFEDSSKEVQEQLLEAIKESDFKGVQGYLKIKNYKEAVAESLYQDEEFNDLFNKITKKAPAPLEELEKLKEVKEKLEIKTGKTVFYKGGEYIVQQKPWYAPARKENVALIQNVKTKETITVAESDLSVRKLLPGELREGKAKYNAKSEAFKGMPGMLRESRIRIHLQKSGYVFTHQEKIESPEDVAFIFRELKNESREKFFAVNLDKNGKIINVDNVSIGSVSANMIHPTEAFKASILSKAESVYFVHNHPTGHVDPSKQDIEVHLRLARVGDILGIKTKGHVIMNTTEFGFFDRKGTHKVYPFREKVDGKIKVRVVEPKRLVREFPELNKKTILNPDDVASITRAVLDKRTDAIMVVYLNSRNGINGVEIKGFQFKNPTKFARELARGTITSNSVGVLVATNIKLGRYIDFFKEVQKSLKLVGLDLFEVVHPFQEGYTSLKPYLLRDEGPKSDINLLREKTEEYWSTTRIPTKEEMEVMKLISAKKEIPDKYKALVDDMIVKGWVFPDPLKVLWKEELMKIRKPKRIRQREAITPEMDYRIKKIKAMIETKEIDAQTVSQIRNGFTGKKRTRVEDLSQDQLDELFRTLLKLTPDQFGKFTLVDQQTLETMRDFIPPSLFGRRAVTRGDIFAHIPEGDINYIMGLLRAPRNVFKGSRLREKLYNTVSEAHENMERDAEKFRKERDQLYSTARKETKEVDDRVIKRIEQDLDVGPKTERLASFLENWWRDSLSVMKPRRIRQKYFTHTPVSFMEIAKKEGLIKSLRDILSPLSWEVGVDPGIIANLEYIISGKKFNPFSLPRLEQREYSKRIYKSTDAYARIYYFKKHFDPVMKEIFRMRLFLAGKERKYLNKWLQNIRGRPLDFDWGNRAHRISSLAVRYEYLRLLAANAGSGIMNVVGGNLNNFAEMPIGKFILGHKRLTMAKGRKILTEYGFTDQSMWLDPVDGVWNRLTKLERGLFFFMKMGEFYLRGIPALASIPETEFKSGELSSKTRTEIRRLIGKTQGLYGKSQSPLAAQTIIGRPLYQFKHWMLVEMELFADWGKEALAYIKRNPTSRFDPIKNPGLRKIIKWLLLAIPLYLWGSEKIKKEIMAYRFLPLAVWRTITHPGEVPVLKDLQLVVESLYDIITGNLELAAERFEKEWLTHLPAGVQVKRVKNFGDFLRKGGYYSATGKLVRKLSPQEAFVELLVGQMSEGAVEYRKMHEDLSKLMPYTYVEYDEYFGQRVRKSDYIKIKEKIIKIVEDKGYKNIAAVKTDKELVQMIKDYNVQAEERLRVLLRKRNEMLDQKITQKEWEKAKKMATIQPKDIFNWMETKNRAETIPSFERRLGR